MTNLGQVCFFSNFVTTHLFSGVGFGSLSWEHLFFTGFKIVIKWWMIKISKGVGMSNREFQISRGSYFFFFYQSKLMSHVGLVSPDTTLKEKPKIKLLTALF